MPVLRVLLIGECCVDQRLYRVFKAQLGMNGNTLMLDG